MNLHQYIRFYSLVCTFLVTTTLLGEGFLAGTLVCTPQGYVAIETLSIGDQVVSCDFDAGYRVEPIVAITSHEVTNFVRFTIGDSTIDVAYDQKFFASFKREWVSATDLTAGCCVLGAPLTPEYIENVQKVNEKAHVYNISLAQHHNYLIGRKNILVHNYDEYAHMTLQASAVGTTALNALLLAHPVIAPVVICAGAVTVLSRVVRAFYESFKESKNCSEEDKNNSNHAQQWSKNFYDDSSIDHVRGFSSVTLDEIPYTCGTSQLKDQLPAPTGNNCLPELHRNPEHFVCPKQEDNSITPGNSCGAEINEPEIKTRPCGFQGQTLPGFGSDELPAGEGEGGDTEEGKNEDDEKDAISNTEHGKKEIEQVDVGEVDGESPNDAIPIQEVLIAEKESSLEDSAVSNIEFIERVLTLLQNENLTAEERALLLQAIEASNNQQIVNRESIAVLKNGYYEVNGFKFTEYYYNKLWTTGRPAPSLIAGEILKEVKRILPDKRAGFMRYETDSWEMIFNPITREIHHFQPIKENQGKFCE